MPPPATAHMDPQLAPERREPALQRADHARGDPRRVPVHSHNGPERLEPEGVSKTPQQLIAPVVMDNCLADHRAQAGHPVREPFRDMSAVQRKIGSPSSSSHQSSCLLSAAPAACAFDDLQRAHCHALALALRIACHTRSGVAGMSIWRTPYSDSASTSAFMTDGSPPAQPASPQPFAPRTLVVAGTGWNS